MTRFFRIGALAPLLLLASLAAAIAQGPTPAEETFWESIKASSNAAEYRAYLEAFPRGFYADRARARIAEIEGTTSNNTRPPAPPPVPYVPPAPNPGPAPYTPTPPPPSNASVLTNYTVIKEVQERLYALNYNVKVMNGQLSRETRDAIRAWQQVVNRSQTGDMTQEDLELLRTAKPITTWGAIAFVARGAYGIVWNRGSRQDAENDAMAECRKYAAGDAKNCDTFTIYDSWCSGMSYYSGGGRVGSFVVRRSSLIEAQQDALEECKRKAAAPRACQLRVSFCADGSHK